MAEPETPRDDAAAVSSAEPVNAGDADGGQVVRDDVVTATLRRSPKYTVFLLLGAGLGVIVALILTLAFPGTRQPSAEGYAYSQGQVFGFLMLICVPAGLVLAGIVALILDRIAARRTRELSVERERFRAED